MLEITTQFTLEKKSLSVAVIAIIAISKALAVRSYIEDQEKRIDQLEREMAEIKSYKGE